jgi:glycosyltransferase involved in cell wall biosynthesis
MNLIYFGTICSSETFAELQARSRVRTGVAAHIFESLFIKGFSAIDELRLKVCTYLPIAPFPSGCLFCWGSKKDHLTGNITTTVLPAINLKILKQLCYTVATFFILLSWLIRNRKERQKAIIIYSIYLPVTIPVVFLARIFECHSTAIVPDVPRLMNSYTETTGVNRLLIPLFVRLTTYFEALFDSYVFITEQMNEDLNKKRRSYVVVEGMVDTDDSGFLAGVAAKKKAVMYAGTLYRKFGVAALLKGFMAIRNPEIELWLFGEGDMTEEVRQCAAKDKRIVFFGSRPRSEVLRHEREATLLVNLRPIEEEFVKYSFPSKTTEYMLSGTPVLTTRLPGIPKDYDEFLYYLDSIEEQRVADAIIDILSKPQAELDHFGKKSAEFVLRHKNCYVQTRKIYDLLWGN